MLSRSNFIDTTCGDLSVPSCTAISLRSFVFLKFANTIEFENLVLTIDDEEFSSQINRFLNEYFQLEKIKLPIISLLSQLSRCLWYNSHKIDLFIVVVSASVRFKLKMLHRERRERETSPISPSFFTPRDIATPAARQTVGITGGPRRNLRFDTGRTNETTISRGPTLRQFGQVTPPSNNEEFATHFREATPLADKLYTKDVLEEHARKDLEDELLAGIKDDLRRLANKLDADDWMYPAKPPLPFRM